jgi:hypothetical protein
MSLQSEGEISDNLNPHLSLSSKSEHEHIMVSSQILIAARTKVFAVRCSMDKTIQKPKKHRVKTLMVKPFEIMAD